MKTTTTLLIAGVLGFTQSLNADVGIGVSANTSDAWIYLPINVSESFRVEPGIRYTSDDDNRSSVEIEFENLELSLGLFGRSQIVDKIGMYYGGRLAYVSRDTKLKSTTRVEESEQDGYRISPTIGFEYFVTERFSVGAEAEWFYMDLSGDEKQNDVNFDLDNKTTGTDARLLVRFLF